MKWKRRVIAPGIVVLCCAVAVFGFSGQILWALGAVLTRAEPPSKADIVVVIGGDHFGDRILKGAELVREGYAPKLLVSGAAEMYGRFESDLSINYAVAHGYPRDAFISLHYPALNTVDEAEADIQELRRLHVHRYLVVTSAFHTARAGRIFRRIGPDLEVHMISAPARYWNGGQWWKNREGRKIWLEETLKTVADYLRI